MISVAGLMNPWGHPSNRLGCPLAPGGLPPSYWGAPWYMGAPHRTIGVPPWAKHTLVRVGIISEADPMNPWGHPSDPLGCSLAHGGIPLNYWGAPCYTGALCRTIGVSPWPKPTVLHCTQVKEGMVSDAGLMSQPWGQAIAPLGCPWPNGLGPEAGPMVWPNFPYK